MTLMTAAEVSALKDALNGIGDRMLKATGEMHRASKKYFWGQTVFSVAIVLLTGVIALAALRQANMI